MDKHILIATLSVSPRDTKYGLGDKVAEANQSPVALLQLLPAEQLPDELMILCTRKIYEDQFHHFKELVESGNLSTQLAKSVKVSALDIPDGKNEEEIWEILKVILSSVPENSTLTLDLTHGFRSFPFLFFTAALYLKALRNVKINSIYYGIADVNTGEDVKPIIELSVILDMVEWFYAARIFKESGQANYIIDLLESFAQPPEGITGSDCAPYAKIKNLKNKFYDTASAYEQSLPIEFGIEANFLSQELQPPWPDHVKMRMPLPDELFSQVRSFIEPYLLTGFSKKNKDKKQLYLDKNELLRQARLIDNYFSQGYINNATTLMREWMVSVALYHNQSTVPENERLAGNEWLLYKAKRKPVENLLSFLADLHKKYEKGNKHIRISEGQRWLAQKWKYIIDKRNGLSHCGFKEEYCLLSDHAIEETKAVWQELKDSVDCAEKWNLNIDYGQGTLLVSPLGKTKGSLYSALVTVKPDYLFILTSEDSKDKVNEILDNAQWEGDREKNLKVYLMEDPYTGFMEIDKASEKAESFFATAEHVVFNLTGGTTVMQYVLNQMLSKFKGYTKTAKQVAFVDRRSVQEQQENPYILGEMITLKEK